MHSLHVLLYSLYTRLLSQCDILKDHPYLCAAYNARFNRNLTPTPTQQLSKMPTYFDTIAMNFANVEVGPDGIDTVQFIQAAEALSQMFTLFNSSAFSVVQNDINGNIKKLRERYEATGEKSKTIELLVKNEQGEKKRTATEGLLWLNRGLRFTYTGLKYSYDNPDQELSASFTKSYSETLGKFHSFIVRGVFNVAMKACPYRANLLKSLGEPEDKVLQQLDEWLGGLGKLTTRIDDFFTEGGYAKGF